MSGVSGKDRLLRIERLIAAPPERVFDFWTNPALFTKWMGPEGFDIPNYEQDFRTGGNWSQTMRAPDGSLNTVRGVYRAIEPPRRLVYTWKWDTPAGEDSPETEVTVTFEPAPGGTRLILLHRNFTTTIQRDRHNTGWTGSLDKLAAAVA